MTPDEIRQSYADSAFPLSLDIPLPGGVFRTRTAHILGSSSEPHRIFLRPRFMDSYSWAMFRKTSITSHCSGGNWITQLTGTIDGQPQQSVIKVIKIAKIVSSDLCQSYSEKVPKLCHDKVIIPSKMHDGIGFLLHSYLHIHDREYWIDMNNFFCCRDALIMNHIKLNKHQFTQTLDAFFSFLELCWEQGFFPQRDEIFFCYEEVSGSIHLKKLLIADMERLSPKSDLYNDASHKNRASPLLFFSLNFLNRFFDRRGGYDSRYREILSQKSQDPKWGKIYQEGAQALDTFPDTDKVKLLYASKQIARFGFLPGEDFRLGVQKSVTQILSHHLTPSSG